MGWQFWSQTIMIKNTAMTHDHHHDTLCWSRQHVSFVYRARFALSFQLPRESKILQWPSESWCRPSCMGMTVLDLNISNGERERETEIHSMTYIYICKWGLYGDTAYINPAIFKGTIRQRTVGSSAHFKENKPLLRCSHWNAGKRKR